MTPFLWPRGRRRFGALTTGWSARPEQVEQALREMFPSAQPVLVSSGRAGLAMALECAGLRRQDLVLVPPYASHCVLEAVARIATPAPQSAGGRSPAGLIYHQWGYVQPGRPQPGILIEDACDSLCAPGAKLLPLGGRFEIWSLPKILGCFTGGVIWCGDTADVERLRRARASRRSGAVAQLALRAMGDHRPLPHAYWCGREAAGGHLPGAGIAEVMSALRRWGETLDLRRRALALLGGFLPAWLPRPVDRLPCVLPLPVTAGLEERLRGLGLGIGVRHLERIHADGRVELIPVLPLPIHQDVDGAALERIAGVLGKLGVQSL